MGFLVHGDARVRIKFFTQHLKIMIAREASKQQRRYGTGGRGPHSAWHCAVGMAGSMIARLKPSNLEREISFEYMY